MNSETQQQILSDIEQLEKSVETYEDQLVLAKALLKQGKKTAKMMERRFVPFPATRTGKVVFGTVEYLTRWTREVNEAMFEALTDPEAWKMQKLENKADKLLSKSTKISDNKHKNAQSIACKISIFLARNEGYLREDTITCLKDEINRLRSDHSKAVKNRINKKVEETFNDKFSSSTIDSVNSWIFCDIQEATEESAEVPDKA